jgi:glycosyltransferase involved in cell wall biosynthesis
MSISVICACKNRTKPLEISLTSWLMFEEIQEIIITDWSSNEPIDHLMKYDEKVKVISVTGEKYFNQPQPLNLAASIATGDYILKLDSDTILNPYYNFFKSHFIDETSFLTGFYDKKEIGTNCYYDGLWGTLYLTKQNFLSVGGYNEHMGDYGAWEDDEIVQRLMMFGLYHKKLDHKLNTIMSIPHSSEERIKNFKSFNEDKKIENNVRKKLESSLSKTDIDKVIFKVLWESHNRINYSKYKPTRYYSEPVVKWELEQISSQQYKAQKILNK